MELRIGTSGWNYPEWSGIFYKGKSNWLQQYAEHFDTVEMNNTFYKLPTTEALQSWKNSVPENFIFSVKASRFITHMKKLIGAPDNFVKFFDQIPVLGEKIGPVLFQLPPRWRCNAARLKEFIEALPKGYNYVFEFRDSSWYCSEVYDLLNQNNCSFCIYELVNHLSPLINTSDLVYVRLHGKLPDYYGDYSEEDLQFWASQISYWRSQGKDIYVYFDNTRGAAIENAKRLKQLCGI